MRRLRANRWGRPSTASSTRTMSAASAAMSLPMPPMAMPTAARFRAGASLMPSPTMHTGPDRASYWSIRRSLSSGRQPASYSVMPSRPATAAAVRSPSPVRSAVRIPRAWRPRIISALSSRTVSASARDPIQRPSTATWIRVSPSSSQRDARPSRSSGRGIPSDPSRPRPPTTTARPPMTASAPRPGRARHWSGRGGAPPPCSRSQRRTTAFPRGCSDNASADAARSRIVSSSSSDRIPTTSGVPWVRVPVLSNRAPVTCARRSKASPSRTKKPCLVAFPIAAMTAVGVASTSAQGQNTTSTVTPRTISPVTAQAAAAVPSAARTIHTAQRSARRTIFALPASADRTRRIMRWMELSAPAREAVISKAPSRGVVPLYTSSPGPLSTGRDSPVMTDWSIEARPRTIAPSAGIVSPGRTTSVSPARTSSAGTVTSSPSRRTRAVRGVRRTRRPIPARARATVRSSNKPPSRMMKATSPAAKISPMYREASRAQATRTSAVISSSVTSPTTASRRMGIPQRTTAVQAASAGRGIRWKTLTSRAAPDRTRKSTSLFVPPRSRIPSSFSLRSDIETPPLDLMPIGA